MKERKELFIRIQKNEDLYKELEDAALEFLKSGCCITNHAYEMHGSLTIENLAHASKVSYFKNGNKGLSNCVNAVVKNSKNGILNFLADSRERNLELIREFKNVIGTVLTDDDTYETRKVCVVISKDSYGRLFTKTAYPII